VTDSFVSFDDTRRRVDSALEEFGQHTSLVDFGTIFLVRDLLGRLRISVSEAMEEDEKCREALTRLADALSKSLGAHGYSNEQGTLFVGDALLETLRDTAQKLRPGVFLADRLVTGRGWWTVDDLVNDTRSRTARITLYSVKGGVGRSTTAAVLAWHLARGGERVLVVDMDLESPGLSSAVLEQDRRPKFGLTDWFVEDLVGQGDLIVEDMLAAPAWAQTLDGDVRVAPAHGRDPGEYLAKLGRVYLDTVGEAWTKRVERVLESLETAFRPTVVLLESRNGLHDIAAASVTDLHAEVLLFATDADSTWTDYGILFRHWTEQGLARRIRERITVASALTPVPDREAYLARFRSKAWDLFRDYLYDEMDAETSVADGFSFDLDEDSAPHNPLEIAWTLGLSAGASLQDLDEETVKLAYGRFLRSFDERIYPNGDGRVA